MGAYRTATAVWTRRASGAPRRRLALLHFFELLICLALLGIFGYALYQYLSRSDRFMVKNIRVEGANVLRDEAILHAADIRADDNVLLTQCEEIQQRVQGLSYVKTCEVQRLYPDTIVINIQERKSLAVLFLNNHLYEIDEEAMVLRELDHYEETSGPLISELPGLALVEIGAPVENEALFEVLQLLTAFRSVPLGHEWTISEFSAPAPNSISMFCQEVPFAVRWGRGDYLQQAQLLEVWWRQVGIAAPCTEYLDLRFGQDLVCK